jgi:hypothetical protein
MIGLLAAVLLAAAEPAPALAGDYQTHQMEVGAALELKADGTFRYQLDYGAVSEAGQGHWTESPGVVHLTSDPLARELLIDIERSDAAFADEQLAIDHGTLVLQRYDTLFTFYRDEQ